LSKILNPLIHFICFFAPGWEGGGQKNRFFMKPVLK
jgi:hypothetical protein